MEPSEKLFAGTLIAVAFSIFTFLVVDHNTCRDRYIPLTDKTQMRECAIGTKHLEITDNAIICKCHE